MGGGRKDMEGGGRKSVNGGYDPSGRKSRIPAAYPVTMLVDLQIYVVPREKWVLSRRLYRHNIVEEGISLGFVRVLPQLSIHNLRRELQLQLGPDVIPRDFIFIRAVGNIFIQLKPKQEIELKVKNFIPPFSAEPEIYLLEVLPNEDPRMISPLPLLLREDTPPHICHDLCHHSLARKIVRRERDADSPQPTTPFPPVSITPSPTPYNHRTPFSPSEYKAILEQYQQDESGQITKSQSDLAARQAAYDYENEIFETPTPTPISKKSGLPRPLVRQKSIHPSTSTDNEDIIENSRTQTATTESPSSADTVRTAIHFGSENESTFHSETQESTSSNQNGEDSNSSTNERKESPKSRDGARQETENETESELKYSTTNHEIITDEHPINNNEHLNCTDEQSNPENKEPPIAEPRNQNTDVRHNGQISLDEVSNLKTEEEADAIVLTQIIDKTKDLQEDEGKIKEKVSSEVNTARERINDRAEHEAVSDINGLQHVINNSAATPLAESKLHEISELKSSEILEQKSSEISELKSSEMSELKSSEISELNLSEISEVTFSKVSERKSTDLSELTSSEMFGRKLSDISERELSQMSELTSNEISERKLSEISELKSTEIAELKSDEVSELKSCELPESLFSEVSELLSSELAENKTHQEDSIANTTAVNGRINSENIQEQTISPVTTPNQRISPETPQEVGDAINTEESTKTLNSYESPTPNDINSKTSEIGESRMSNKDPISGITLIPITKETNPEEVSMFKVPETSQSKSQINALKMDEVDREKRKKAKEFRDLRKPAAYPQRMTKTTIARQALAREKRRVYVEERIQSYMRNSQQTSSKSFYPQTRTREDHEGQPETRNLEKDGEKVGKASVDLRNRDTNTPRDPNAFQSSLPDINAYHYNFNPNPNIYSPYRDTSPKTLSAISVIKPPPYSYSSPFAMAEANAHRSHSEGTTQETYDTGSGSSGIYVDSNTEATSNYWKNVSEQGFFYSFRVRQSGTVQMIDKGIQTGEQPQSYILDFSRKSDGSYYQKSSKPLPQTSSTTHLPPITRDKILRDISETVQLRHDAELRRAELIQRANDLQALVKEKREKINRRHEFWHKKYIEESSMTRPMEAACNSLRSELNTVHRRLIAHLEGRDLPLRLRDGPSKKANYKIMAARLQHEIKELQQKAKSAKLRLESEIKLKEQAEREVRDIRNDLAHKKVVMSLARSQIGGTLPSAHPRSYDTLVY